VKPCQKTGPDGRKGIPFLRLRCQAGDPPPLRPDRFPGRAGSQAGNEAGRTEKETIMSLNNTKKNETAETKNPPAGKVRVGLITASIWENKTEKGIFHNVTFERRYRDAEGNWKSSHSYNAEDLLSLAKAADLAHTKIVEARNGDDE
jgi:hypothetical protein